ncbi:MAG: hypothetical protein ABI867_44755 [Kofleriaceae bacterium]
MTERAGDDDYATDPVRLKRDHRVLALVLAGVSAACLVFAALSHQWLYAGETQLQYRVDEHTSYPVGPIVEVGFGLRSGFECTEGTCETFTNAELVRDWRVTELHARLLLHEPVDDELLELDPDRHSDGIAQRDRMERPDTTGHEQVIARAMAEKHVYQTSSAFSAFGWIALIATWIAALSLVVACAMVLSKRQFAWPVMPPTTALLGIATALITGCVFAALKPGPAGYVGVGVGFIAFGIGMVLGLWSSIMLAKLLRPTDPDLLEDAMNPEQF